MLIFLLIFALSPSYASSFFQADTNVSRVDVTRFTRTISFGANEKLVVLHRFADEFILLGGRNHVYNISVGSMSEINRYEWSPSDEARSNCAAISQTPVTCENYIRTYFELTNGTFILCGTHGLQPTCAEFRRGNEQPLRLISAVGMSPIDADSTSPFIRSADNIITVNVAELSSSEPLLVRRNVIKMWKGIENDVILRTPRGLSSFEQATFLSMHKVKKEVLFFFSESPMETEGCGLHKVARVGRVCEDDPGGRLSYSKEWSSYAKARLECSIEEDNTDTFYFNQFSGVSESQESFYGAFRSQLAGIGASAICKFNKEHISKSIASGFKENDHDSEQCARANELEELSKLRLKPLIKQKISANPIYIFHGKDRFVNVLAQEDVSGLSDNHLFDILYISTNLGNILKVVVPKNGTGRHAITLKTIPPINSKIVEMKLYGAEKNGDQSLIVVTDQNVLKIPTATCHLAQNCGECLAHGDPHCAWADGAQCIDIRVDTWKTASQDSGTCDVVGFEKNKPVVLAPLKTREEPPKVPLCLCETKKSIPCSTEVIQKEIILANHHELWKFIAVFALGLLVGSIFNYCYFFISRRKKRTAKTAQHLLTTDDSLEQLLVRFDGKLAPSTSSRSSSSMTRPIATSSTGSRLPIDAFTTSSIADEMFSSTLSSTANNNRLNSVSMHSSIRTYC
uniref:Sema domain-containing protein n=1 Tax=Caenorhabditis japonica TaxID=281687 RepID=A0A8R1E1V8_CAEJA